jgi:hypothetical protein
MRYRAPDRDAVAPGTFGHPAYARLAAHRALLAGAEWPALDALNRALGARRHPQSGVALRFAAQDAALLGDGLHYETRIFEQGAIATRERNWHDLINALVWIEHTALKAALNARQARDVAEAGGKRRTRGQCALTHFDEAGVLVLVREPALLERWDAHDWRGLFWDARDAWREDAPAIEAIVFGHALLEHLLKPHQLLVGKALVAWVGGGGDPESAIAGAIAADRLLADPQELRPLPLSGIPGWHADNGREAFYREAECFRALRPGRRYPPPSAIGPS